MVGRGGCANRGKPFGVFEHQKKLTARRQSEIRQRGRTDVRCSQLRWPVHPVLARTASQRTGASRKSKVLFTPCSSNDGGRVLCMTSVPVWPSGSGLSEFENVWTEKYVNCDLITRHWGTLVIIERYEQGWFSHQKACTYACTCTCKTSIDIDRCFSTSQHRLPYWHVLF